MCNCFSAQLSRGALYSIIGNSSNRFDNWSFRKNHCNPMIFVCISFFSEHSQISIWSKLLCSVLITKLIPSVISFPTSLCHTMLSYSAGTLLEPSLGTQTQPCLKQPCSKSPSSQIFKSASLWIPHYATPTPTWWRFSSRSNSERYLLLSRKWTRSWQVEVAQSLCRRTAIRCSLTSTENASHP